MSLVEPECVLNHGLKTNPLVVCVCFPESPCRYITFAPPWFQYWVFVDQHPRVICPRQWDRRIGAGRAHRNITFMLLDAVGVGHWARRMAKSGPPKGGGWIRRSPQQRRRWKTKKQWPALLSAFGTEYVSIWMAECNYGRRSTMEGNVFFPLPFPPQHGVILPTVFLTPTQRVSQR